LKVINSTVTENLTSIGCEHGCAVGGGGIYNAAGATLTINKSTLSANLAKVTKCPLGHCFSDGGGIYNGGKAIITNSTFSGNSAELGGGIATGGTTIISNSTIGTNSSGIYNFSGGATTLQNSILASNTGGNCSGSMVSNGYNLSDDASCNFANTGDLNNTDPMLGPLQFNGGPTQTMALPSGSPAVDAGNPSGCTDNLGHLLKTDQRGKPRPNTEDTGGCDMGAYERQSD
jgi:hypothetical protein